MSHKCDKCGHELELCPSDWPWYDDFWICPKCKSTNPVDDRMNLLTEWMINEWRMR